MRLKALIATTAAMMGLVAYSLSSPRIIRDGHMVTEGGDPSPFVETDPTVPVHVKGISTTDVARWDTALQTETDPTVPAHVKAVTTNSIGNWNTAYSWGDHSGLYRTITWVPDWTDILNTPTTIEGYGITNAVSPDKNNYWGMTNTFNEIIVSNGFTIGDERRTTWPIEVTNNYGGVITRAETDAATASTSDTEVYTAKAAEQAMRMRASWEPSWLVAESGTVTVSRTSGNLQAYSATGAVTIAVSPCTTNLLSAVNFFIDTGGHSITWLTNGVEYSSALATSGVVNIVYYSPLFSTTWKGNIIGD